jgi:hypothetical protein
MLGDGVTAFIFAVGLGTWVYGKLVRSTNSSQNSLIGGGIAAVVGFIVVFTLLKYLLQW